jgi:hypothetical protein
MTTNNQPTFPEVKLPLGWNALINDAKKTALICGEYKVVGKAFTILKVLNKPTKDELLAAIETLGYTSTFPSQVVAPPAQPPAPPTQPAG